MEKFNYNDFKKEIEDMERGIEIPCNSLNSDGSEKTLKFENGDIIIRKTESSRREIDGYYDLLQYFASLSSISGKNIDIKDLAKYNGMSFEEINKIDIAELGSKIGMKAKEQTLPNGKVVKSLVWDQENLLKAVEAVKHLSEEGKKVRITGAAPAWLVSALIHTVHPCPVSVYVPQIGKDVDIPKLSHGEKNPEGEVSFKTTEQGDAILIEYNMDLPEGITTYDENNLSKVVVPEIPYGKAVYLSGRGPNYLTTAIAEAYSHTNSSVSLFQPGVGYTCSITHSRNKRLGDLTKDPIGKEKLKEKLVASKEAKTNESITID